MAISTSVLRTQLVALTNSSGIHKEQVDKYRSLLDQILLNTGNELVDTLKLFIEASKLLLDSLPSCAALIVDRNTFVLSPERTCQLGYLASAAVRR